jgi:hypothetical protein
MNLRLTDPLGELPWMRRERVDANIRRATFELRELAAEDTVWQSYYLAMADTFDAALLLLNTIEDAADKFSVKV